MAKQTKKEKYLLQREQTKKEVRCHKQGALKNFQQFGIGARRWNCCGGSDSDFCTSRIEYTMPPWDDSMY